MDKSKKWLVCPDLQKLGFLSEASYNDFLVWGYTDGPDHTGLVDRDETIMVFLYRGVWRHLDLVKGWYTA